MKKLFLLLLGSSSLFAQQNAGIVFGGTATISCFSDPNFVVATQCSAKEGQTLYLVASAGGSWSTYGVFSGTLTPIDATHARYVAPAQVTAAHTVAGVQTLPNDEIMFTPIDKLPLISSHSMGDGSGFCETTATNRCQGDPLLGTGYYQMVEPVAGTTLALRSCGAAQSPAGSIETGNVTNTCHIGQSQAPINLALTTQEMVLNNTETFMTQKEIYGGTTLSTPDVRLKWYEVRQGGNWSIPQPGCNLVVGVNGALDSAIPPYPNCTPGGTAPYALTGADQHQFMVNPFSLETWELYGDESRFGGNRGCRDGTLTCTVDSFKNLHWYDYQGKPGIGIAGTPENQLELSGQDLEQAALGNIPIQHMYVGTLSRKTYLGGTTGGQLFNWPALGPDFTNIVRGTSGQVTTQTVATLPTIGQRWRLSSTRASNINPATGITVTNVGSGYTPGQAVSFNITGCQSIDGVHSASGIVFIGTTGSVAGTNAAGGPPSKMAYITNTGTNCVSPQAIVPPPTSGTQIQVTISAFPFQTAAWKSVNLANALFTQAQKYGIMLDDATTNPTSLGIRVNGSAAQSQYYSDAQNMFSAGNANAVGFGNMFLWDQVDTSGMIPQGNGWPAGAVNTTNGMRNYWIADSSNAAQGSDVHTQAIIKFTTSAGGAVTYSPIPLLGVGVGSVSGDHINTLNIASGMTAYQIPYWVTGDPTNAGAKFEWVTDPCPGSDTLTLSGLYTTCPQFNATTVKSGVIKLTALANTNAVNYIDLTVVPVDSSGNIRIDMGGNGATIAGTGDIWAQGCCYQIQRVGSGVAADSGGTAWKYAHWGGKAAPTSIPAEQPIYQSFVQDADITVSIIVPNGNYRIRELAGEPFNGYGGNQTFPIPNVSWHNFSVLQTQNGVEKYAVCYICNNDMQFGTPIDNIIPNKVTNNLLFFSKRYYNPSRFSGWSPYNVDTFQRQGSVLTGLAIYKDTTTTPYWEIGSYLPDQYKEGDRYLVTLNDGVHTTPNHNGNPSAGVMQLYVRDWFVGLRDAVWTKLSGPGSIDPVSGIYVAPTTLPSGNSCALIQATSASNPSIRATQRVCVVGSASWIL